MLWVSIKPRQKFKCSALVFSGTAKSQTDALLHGLVHKYLFIAATWGRWEGAGHWE